jgi:hypothetical protein
MWPVCKLKGGGGGKRGGGQGGMPGGHVIGDDALGDEREDASGKWGDVFRGSAGTTRARALARGADIHAHSRRNRERAHCSQVSGGRLWFP